MPELLQQWQIQARCLWGLSPLIFRPKWGPKGRKKYFWQRPPSLSQSLDGQIPPPPLSEGLDLPMFSTDSLKMRLLALETRCSSLGWDTCLSRNEMRLVHVAFFWAVYCRTAFTVSSTVKGWDSLGTENWQISVKIVLSYANVAFFTV